GIGGEGEEPESLLGGLGRRGAAGEEPFQIGEVDHGASGPVGGALVAGNGEAGGGADLLEDLLWYIAAGDRAGAEVQQAKGGDVADAVGQCLGGDGLAADHDPFGAAVAGDVQDDR